MESHDGATPLGSESFGENIRLPRFELGQTFLLGSLTLACAGLRLTCSDRVSRILDCSLRPQQKSALPDLNGGQADLQSAALPG